MGDTERCIGPDRGAVDKAVPVANIGLCSAVGSRDGGTGRSWPGADRVRARFAPRWDANRRILPNAGAGKESYTRLSAEITYRKLDALFALKIAVAESPNFVPIVMHVSLSSAA